jgi:hypothetical protein
MKREEKFKEELRMAFVDQKTVEALKEIFHRIFGLGINGRAGERARV